MRIIIFAFYPGTPLPISTIVYMELLWLLPKILSDHTYLKTLLSFKPEHAWFLEIIIYMCWYVCESVCPPKDINNQWHDIVW